MVNNLRAASNAGVSSAREENLVREFIGILFARKRLIIGVFLAFSLLTILVVLFAPSIYVAESELVVLSKKVVQNPESGMLPAEFLPPAPEDLQTEINILLSPALVRETVAALLAEGVFDDEIVRAEGTAPSQPVGDYIKRLRLRVGVWFDRQLQALLGSVSRERFSEAATAAKPVTAAAGNPLLDDLATSVADNLQAEIAPGSNVIHLSYTDDDPDTVHVTLNRLVRNYLQRRQTLLLNEGSSAYFAQKKRAYKRRLESLSGTKLALLRKGNTADPQGELTQSLEMVSDETRQLYALQDDYAKERQWLDYVKTQSRNLNTGGDPTSLRMPQHLQDDELLAQQQRVAQIQQAYVRAGQVYVSESRRITALAQRLDAARERLGELIANRVTEREARVRMLGSAVRDARQRIAGLRARAQILERVRTETEQLNTELRVVRQAYLDFSRRLERARAEESTDAGQISNVQVLNRATAPLQPAFPNAKAIVPVGLVAAVMLGLMVGYLREYFDRTFRRPSHVREHLDVAVIASILMDKRYRSGAASQPAILDQSAASNQPGVAGQTSHHEQTRPSANEFETNIVNLRDRAGAAAVARDADAPAARRVLHLLSPEGSYGAERVLLNQMRVMPRTNFAVAYFSKATQGQNDFLDAVRAHRGALYPLEDRLLRAPRSLREIRAAIRASGAELIHCHGYKATVLGLIAAAGLRLPVVVTQHGIIQGRAKLRLYNFLDKLACRFFRAAHVICVTPEIYHKYRRFGVPEQRLRLLPNATQVPEKLTAHSGADSLVLAQFAPGERRLFVLYVGRLSDEKGPDLFLDMIARLRQAHSNVMGVVVGDGPMRVSLLERAKALNLYNHIRFTGFRDDASALIAHADLVVIPSRSEGLPMVLLEAMAAGAPVVATAVGGVPQVLKNGETGLMVAPGDSAALAEAAGTLLTSTHQRERLRQRAWAFVREHHSLQEQARIMANLYAQAVDGTQTATQNKRRA